MNRSILFYLLALLFFSCNQEKESEANKDFLYFDIKGYFDKEAQRLHRDNPTVLKSVGVNKNFERKTLKIGDWETELSIFSNADINKTAWKGSFKITTVQNVLLYTASEQKIPVKTVLVKKENNKVKEIKIIIHNKNILYYSSDTLIYIPDSLYQVNKQQKIRFFKNKSYQISGKLIK